MTKSAFSKIAAGLEDAIAFAEGDGASGRIAHPVDVKHVRTMTGKSHAAFAKAYRLPVATVQDWEQKRRQPDAPARAYLKMIEAEPETVDLNPQTGAALNG